MHFHKGQADLGEGKCIGSYCKYTNLNSDVMIRKHLFLSKDAHNLSLCVRTAGEDQSKKKKQKPWKNPKASTNIPVCQII